ncbi:hypothetical protein M8J77_013056 [Diaphorina citri]|nr:hypothetical protein M8J77_013056 [Diaphorina citri]
MKISIVFMLICIAITTTSASPLFNNWQESADKSKILSARIKEQSERQLREEGLEAAKKPHMRYRREDISKFRTRLNGWSEFLFGREPFYTKFWFGKKLHNFFSDMRVEYGRYQLRKTIDRLNREAMKNRQ